MAIFKTLIGKSSQAEIITTALDLTRIAASYASDTRAIEPLLRQIRVISHDARSDGLLSPEEEHAVFDTYFQIEHFLTTSDPIRKFSKEELRGKASRGLRVRLEAYENELLSQKQRGVVLQGSLRNNIPVA